MSVVSKRAGHRGQITKLKNRIDLELARTSPSLENLDIYHEELLRQKNIILDLDKEVLGTLTTDKDIQNEISECSDCMMNINMISRKIMKIINENSQKACKEDHQSLKNVKLPQIKLLKFSGEPLEWLSFWDLYRTSVHDRTDLPEPLKFQYLMGQLEGQALDLVSGFNLSAAEYGEAVELLKKNLWSEEDSCTDAS